LNAEKYPIRLTFFGCCASANEAADKTKLANTETRHLNFTAFFLFSADLDL
jgi:hypothetical protein